MEKEMLSGQVIQALSEKVGALSSLKSWNETCQQIPLPLWLAAASWGPVVDAAKGGPCGGRWHQRLVVPQQPMRNGTWLCDSAEIHNKGGDCALRKGNSYLQRQKIKVIHQGAGLHKSLFESRHDGMTLSNSAWEFLSSALWLFQFEAASVLWKAMIKLLPSIVSKYRSNQDPVLSSRSQREMKWSTRLLKAKAHKLELLGTLQALTTYSLT